MEINYRVLVLAIACLSFALHQGSGAMWHGKGCEGGRKPGDSWFVNQCGVCRCYEFDMFSCYSCGVLVLAPQKDCYVDHIDAKANYPKCCGKKYVCKGDDDFNFEKFNNYWKNKNIIG